MPLEQFKQKLKIGTHTITFFECENPKDSAITHRHSKNKEHGHDVIISGENAIKRFKDWINTLPL